MSLGYGFAPGTKDIWTKSRSPGVAKFRKNRVIVPWAGRRDWVMEVSGSDAPAFRS